MAINHSALEQSSYYMFAIEKQSYFNFSSFFFYRTSEWISYTVLHENMGVK